MPAREELVTGSELSEPFLLVSIMAAQPDLPPPHLACTGGKLVVGISP